MKISIEAKNVTKEFKGKEILRDISLSVEKGQIYGLLGANGAGKTTLMKIMLGLLKPTSGEMSILGTNVLGADKSYLTEVGNLIENPVFYQHLTVRENLELHCDYLKPEYKANISEMLELIGLSDIEHKYVKELSLGMKQRLAIGRSLLTKPQLLILDEPINGIDPEGIVEIRNILRKINQEEGTTIIISSHIINELEKTVDKVGIISDGKLLEELSKEKFLKDDFNLEEHFIEIIKQSKNK